MLNNPSQRLIIAPYPTISPIVVSEIIKLNSKKQIPATKFISGPAIETKGRNAEEINKEVYDWIEGAMERISDKSRWGRK